MAESVLRVKARLQEQYLGRFGIHGIGVNQEKDTIHIYYWPEPGVDMGPVLEKIRSESGRYNVILIREQRSVLM